MLFNENKFLDNYNSRSISRPFFSANFTGSRIDGRRVTQHEMVDFFEKTDYDELLQKWYGIHADVCKFGNSGLRPVRLCCMTIILQPLEHGIVKHYD